MENQTLQTQSPKYPDYELFYDDNEIESLICIQETSFSK